MSFDAVCQCFACGHFWYECANEGEVFNCPACGQQGIEPEELDLMSFDDILDI